MVETDETRTTIDQVEKEKIFFFLVWKVEKEKMTIAFPSFEKS